MESESAYRDEGARNHGSGRADHGRAGRLSIGGTDQAGPNQTYSYFLVRNRGEYFIANREGDRAWF
jgi:hypothetical protein